MTSKSQGLGALPLLAYHHPKIVLVIILTLTLIAGFAVKQLTIDADLSALLPDTFASVQDLEKIKTFFGGIGYVVVTAQGVKPQSLRKFADEVARIIAPMETVKFVDYHRPVEFFRDRALYFLETDDLEIILKRIKKRWKWEKNKRNPMYIDLEDSPAPPITFQDLERKYSSGGESNWMSKQNADEAYYFNNDKSLIAIFIKPRVPSSDLTFTQQLLTDIRQKIDSLDLSTYGNNIKIEFTGRYQKRIELQRQMQKDLGLASLVALFLVISYLLLHFKRFEAVVLILLPLLIGIILTFAFASLLYGSLNILTAFIGVILLGLGIDHGIHLISRYQDERKNGIDESQVIIKTFSQTGLAVTIAALTTLVIFVGLGFSEFRAFHEFGVIAAAGMILIVFSYLICLPPLLRLLVSMTRKNVINIAKKRPEFKFFDTRWQKGILSICAICILFLSMNIGNVRFNYDFESLGNTNLRAFQLDREVNDLLGYSQTPLVALSDNDEQVRFVSDLLRKNQQTLGEKSGIDFMLSSSDLVPLEQQEKLIIIKKIGKVVQRIKDGWLASEDLRLLQDFRKMVKSTPFNYADLPLEIRQLFGIDTNKKDQQKGVIMVFPSISLSDGRRVLQFAEEIRAVQQSDGQRLPIAGESMILADILNLVFVESPWILLYSGLCILLLMFLFMKNLSYTILCLLPAILTISLTLSVMAVLNIELNYINMLMIPILLGIGVDSGIHMVSRAIEGNTLRQILNETGLAIFGSIVTSGLGIGTLWLTDHSGLNSLAHVAVIGLSINLLVSLILLPLLLNLKPVQLRLQKAV